MNILQSRSRDLDRIRAVSAKLDSRLEKCPDLDGLSHDELKDLKKIVDLADFMLAKYSEKREMRSILKDFVRIITDSARSLEAIDDDVSELILEAEDSIIKVKDMHTRISDSKCK